MTETVPASRLTVMTVESSEVSAIDEPRVGPVATFAQYGSGIPLLDDVMFAPVDSVDVVDMPPVPPLAEDVDPLLDVVSPLSPQPWASAATSAPPTARVTRADAPQGLLRGRFIF